MLLALLEMNTGIGPCLKFLCLFDKGLQKNAKIEDLSVKWQTADSEGKSNIEIEFKNSTKGFIRIRNFSFDIQSSKNSCLI